MAANLSSEFVFTKFRIAVSDCIFQVKVSGASNQSGMIARPDVEDWDTPACVKVAKAHATGT